MESAEDGGGHHFGVVGGRIDEGEAAVFAEVGTGEAGDVGHGEGVLVTGDCAAFVGGFQGGVVEGRIADDEGVGMGEQGLGEGLEGEGVDGDAVVP